MSAPNAKIQLSIRLLETLSAGIRYGTVPAEISEIIDLVNGTSDGQIDKAYVVTATGKAASSTTQYDLAAGALFDIDGAVVTFAEVCFIAIRNKRTTALANISIGPHTANGFGILAGGKGFWNAAHGAGGGSIVAPGSGWLAWYDPTGVPVTPGTADVLAVICSAVAGDINSWDLVILGRSA